MPRHRERRKLPKDLIGIRTCDLCSMDFLPEYVGDFQVEEERRNM
jgi:hypothetical protein